MIIVHINPAGVERVYFESSSDLMEDLSMAIWPLVRSELNKLHRKLRAQAQRTLEEIERRDRR